jgi:anti-sigma regulatory factor (Ser/Thr protein kinase)
MKAAPVLLGYISFSGVPELVPGVRHYARRLLGEEHPAVDDVELLVSEVVSNAVRHSDSGRGGSVSVAVTATDHLIHVDVIDDGSAHSVPHLRGDTPESGHGLVLVQQLAAAWGVTRDQAGTAVWFSCVVP